MPAVNQKLALGTAQFGMPYGIANIKGHVSESEARLIIARADQVGINTLDTANAYGNAEQILGKVGIDGWRVISKLPGVNLDETNIATWVENKVAESLARLKSKKLDGLLLHRPDDLLGQHGDELYKTLIQVKESGLVTKIGISIYDSKQLDEILCRYKIDLIQAPFNIFDRRLQQSGWLGSLNSNNIEVHVRSIFLQGLLLIPPNKRPTKFNRWQSLWDIWDQWLQDSNITPLAACLSYVLNFPGIERVLVGVDSLEQFDEILSASKVDLPQVPQELYTNDINLINPSMWSDI